MHVGAWRRDAPTGRACEQPLLKQKWLVDVLDGVRRLPHRIGEGAEASGAPRERHGEVREDLAVQIVEACGVYLKNDQRLLGDVAIHRAHSLHLRHITYAAQQTVGDTRGAT